MKLWVHLKDGIVRGLMMAEGYLDHDEHARYLGEWVLEGITPLLYEFGSGPAKINVSLPPTAYPLPLPDEDVSR